MGLYIQSAGIVSAAGSSADGDFLQQEFSQTGPILQTREPDYTGYITAMQLRRMSKAVRMSIGAAHVCFKNAGIEKPDALSIGTAMGCLQDTENFLAKMVAQEEQMLTPTAFVQSTHNTVSGQIALLYNCLGYNLTFTHRGHSFEHAMLNTELYLNQHPNENMLVGGIDELTETSYEIMRVSGVYDTFREVKAGEGAGFFLLSKQKSPLEVKAISSFFTKNQEDAISLVRQFIQTQNLSPANIDFCLLGINGDSKTSGFYKAVREDILPDVSLGKFKHLSGEYATASAIGLGVLYHAVQNGLSGNILMNESPGQFKKMLIINHYQDYYSCWHLAAP